MGNESMDLYPSTTSWKTIDDIPLLTKEWIETVKGKKLVPNDLPLAKELVEGYDDFIKEGQYKNKIFF